MQTHALVPDNPSLSEMVRRTTNRDKFIPSFHVMFMYDKLVRRGTWLSLPYTLPSLNRVHSTRLVVAAFGEINKGLAFVCAPNPVFELIERGLVAAARESGKMSCQKTLFTKKY